MMTKKTTAKKAPATTPAKKTELRATQFDGITKDMTQSQMQAALATRSTMTAFTIKAFSGCGDALDEADIMDELRKAGDEVVSGNMGRVEKMLTNQAIALDNIFNNMAQRSHNQQSFKGIEVLMRLALKAQAQARSTAEALALLKNPQPYIRQANIAQGHQQVNNSYASASGHSAIPTGAGDFENSQNKLLEVNHGNYMDTRAQGAASRVNSDMEAVG